MTKAVASVLLLILVVFALLIVGSSSEYKQYSANDEWQELLPMTFAHSAHKEQKCTSCHHNYVDNSGQGQCILCHQSDTSVNFKIEEQFHQLCQGCHQEKQLSGEVHGPTRDCRSCHTVDTDA